MSHTVESIEFSKWFRSVCDYHEIPIIVAMGASAMMAALPDIHWSVRRRYLSSVTCLRLAYKWVYDYLDTNKLSFLLPYIGFSERVNWLEQEVQVLMALDWKLRAYFEKPINQVVTPRRLQPLSQITSSKKMNKQAFK